MAFKASNVLPSDAYRTVKRAAVQLKVNLQGMVSYMGINGADYDYLKAVYLTLNRARDQFNDLKTTPGLSQYARDQENSQAYDVGAEFNSMVASIDAALTWIDANVPTNVTVKPPGQWGNETMISNTFTAGQTAGLRTALQAVVVEIE